MSYIIGIDPGEKGAMCALDEDGKIVEYDVFKKVGKEVDWENNLKLLVYFVTLGGGNNTVYIEDLHALGLVKASTNFKLGRYVGWIHGAANVFTNNIHFVAPKKWQKEIWEMHEIRMKDVRSKDTKAISLLSAERLFPGEDFIPKDCKRCTKPNDNIVDASLIAYYGYLKQK